MMVIKVIEGNHTLKPSRFVFLVIKVSSLTICPNLIIDIFNFVQFCFGVEVLFLL